jgi:hypothetical protein
MKTKNLIVLTLLATLLVCTAFASFANAADDGLPVSSATHSEPVIAGPPEPLDDAPKSEPISEQPCTNMPIHPNMDTTFTAPDAPAAVDETQINGIGGANLISSNTDGNAATSTATAPEPATAGSPETSKDTTRPEQISPDSPVSSGDEILYTAQDEKSAITADDAQVPADGEANLTFERTGAGADNTWLVVVILTVLAVGVGGAVGVVYYRKRA